MKEIKVYMSKLPKSCVGCKYFAENRRQCNLELCVQWSEEKFKFNDCPLIDIKTHDRELVKEVCEKIIKFINELAWKDIQYDAVQSTIGEFNGSRSAIPIYAKRYLNLWKQMFGEDLENKG